jgi:hypothetical protein
MRGPGVVARCAVCENVLLRLANVRQRVFLDARGLTYLSIEALPDQVRSRSTTIKK